MNTSDLSELVQYSIQAHERFRSHWESFPAEDSAHSLKDGIDVLNRLEERLEDNYPFFHPRYAGQMLKPPHPIAIAAYLMAMQINPNNHALDGGPATAKMETEAVRKIASMFGYDSFLGHLTSSGTIANLEALWIAKSLHPDKKIAFTKNAHYTHQRMCGVINAEYVVLDSFDSIEEDILRHHIGTIVVTLGTTSTGSVEPLDQILPLAHRMGVRVHADAAYGGFFTLLAQTDKPPITAPPFLALKNADSIVVDPHKHGLQPYGCGCILFKDPDVGRLYKHDSPYTYFTSKELHLGEISLECSRPGAAAAALWATLEYLPLHPETGLGAILSKTRASALRFSEMLSTSSKLHEFMPPDLDIVTYFPKPALFTASEVSRTTENAFIDLMSRKERPLYLATLIVDSQLISRRYQDFIPDRPTTKIFRSVFMKPEHYDFLPVFLKELEDILTLPEH
jgi:glutamate/tyrosine decarboxylase-like PLP-dependent enzyme